MNPQTQKKLIHRRKNFLPTLLLTLILWLLLAFLVYFFSPQDQFTLPLFFTLVFLALFLSSALILAHTRRGLFLALAITLFLLLRYLGQGHLLNGLLIFGLLLAIEFYFSR